ncbi:UDP-2,3-diacylglucosamine diphosphatase [Donghicola tyrosinivorans]|uniref:UDP-2,3-diacylglucosamine pyrophosphatase LpxH n=1 Tax=Donghicola tyrosinivorans TaxID=1652492 RepID=A0A2T0WUI9_9RHOB|nr:UDP-2,3-diacylglucosamine diphosphatase [Donghicola tyrosinivorans]PRY90234.1 UDP-2,3-diacylglucosamine pyrophosphatase LpxH [Donghicola tyrosinivorans]
MTPFVAVAPEQRIHCRSLFLSDIHLGARGARPDAVTRMLQMVEAETVYLVGDILDFWHGGQIHWSEDHDALLNALRQLLRRGRNLVYLPGNHDAPMRTGADAPKIGWHQVDEALHTTASGQQFLVIHGDQCDGRILRQHFMTRLGSRMDCLLRWLDAGWRDRFALPDSRRTPVEILLSSFNKMLCMGYTFERRALALAREKDADGVICGHSHRPVMRSHDGMLFANCGDWVDGMTALIEDTCGTLRLLDFTAVAEAARAERRAASSDTPLPEAIS